MITEPEQLKDLLWFLLPAKSQLQQYPKEIYLVLTFVYFFSPCSCKNYTSSESTGVGLSEHPFFIHVKFFVPEKFISTGSLVLIQLVIMIIILNTYFPEICQNANFRNRCVWWKVKLHEPKRTTTNILTFDVNYSKGA